LSRDRDIYYAKTNLQKYLISVHGGFKMKTTI